MIGQQIDPRPPRDDEPEEDDALTVAAIFDDFDALEAPVEAAEAPSDDALRRIATLAERLRAQERAVADAEAALDAAKAALRLTATVDLPEALADAGCSGFTLADGSKVEVDRKLFASISRDDQADAFDWLIESGNGSLIKTTLTVEFGRGEREAAVRFAEAVRGRWPARTTILKEGVHAQSLNALVRELDRTAKPFPEDVLGVHRTTEAVVTPPKPKRAKAEPKKQTRGE